MKIRNLLAAVALAGTALAISSAPASAHTDVCVGQGTATTTPLYYPGVNGLTTGTPGAFSLATDPALTVCVSGDPTLTAAGTFGPGPVAYCGHSTGTGTVEGHSFTYVSAGTLLVLEGTPALNGDLLAGVASAIPDALNGQSCLSGATKFIVTGAVAFVL